MIGPLLGDWVILGKEPWMGVPCTKIDDTSFLSKLNSISIFWGADSNIKF